jgi:hypothetical protein
MSYYGTKPEIIENLEKELAAALAGRNKAVADADHFFVLSGQYLARANEAEAQRDKALVALNSIKEYWNQDRNDKEMFYACWFAIHTAELVLKECWKPKVEK